MAEVFPEKTPELERYNVIALYCVISELIQQYVIGEIKPHLHHWFIEFARIYAGSKRRSPKTREIGLD